MAATALYEATHQEYAMRVAGLTIALICAATAAAQDLEVSLSPLSPGAQEYYTGEALTAVLGAFRLAANGSLIRIDGVTLTALGSADFSEELDSARGVQVRLDDGDGIYDPALDSLLSQSGGAHLMPHTFQSPIFLAPAATIDLWVVVSILAPPGPVPDRTFAVSIANVDDVIAPGATVSIGVPSPVTNSLKVVTFKCDTCSGSARCSASTSPFGLALPYALPLAALLFARRRQRVEARLAAPRGGP